MARQDVDVDEGRGSDREWTSDTRAQRARRRAKQVRLDAERRQLERMAAERVPMSDLRACVTALNGRDPEALRELEEAAKAAEKAAWAIACLAAPEEQ